MSRVITAKVNAAFPALTYLNIGGEESVCVDTSNFKSLPMKGEKIEFEGAEVIRLRGHKNARLSFSNYKMIDRIVDAPEQAVEETVEPAF